MIVKMIKNLEDKMEKMQESINKDLEELKNKHSETTQLQKLNILLSSSIRGHTEHISHQTLDMALSLIKRVKPERAYLIHMSHHMGLHEVESKKLPENVYFAHDGLLIDTEYI